MKSKLFLLVLLGLLLLIGGLVLNFLNPSLSSTAYIIILSGIILSKFFGLLMLVLASNIMKTIYFKLILFSIAIVLLGEVFFINQWGGSFFILIAGAFSTITIYSVRFYSKKEKKRLDVLKLLWILTTYMGMSLIVLNYLPKEAGYFSELIFWLMIADYSISTTKKQTLTAINS